MTDGWGSGADSAVVSWPGRDPQSRRRAYPAESLARWFSSEMLQNALFSFSVIVGVAFVSIPAEQAKPLLELRQSVQAACISAVDVKAGEEAG